MPRSVAEIQAEIAKVKQEIATRDMYRQPRTQVGWASYVGNGDRGLLDAYQNREDQYNKMMKQQQFQAAERALQQKFQEQENERNRENARVLAKEQRIESSLYQMDENMKSRANAATKQQYAQYDLDQAKKSGVKADIERAKMNLALANNELNYWNKRVGYTEPKETNEQTPQVQSETPKSSDSPVEALPVELERYEAIKTFETDKDKQETLNKMKSHPLFGQDAKLQAQYERLSKIKSNETKKKERAERKKKYDSYATQYKTPDGRIRPGSLQKLLDNDSEFKKLHKEFGGD